MSQTAIPLEFERYLQNQISVGKAPDMNEMIFAYIPGLDPSQPIDRSKGLPDVGLWVHQQDIDQVGKMGDNILVYSVVIPGGEEEFTFNAIYLRDKKVPNSCGIVVHKAEETKENGMASTKSLAQQYDGAAQIAGITVDAATWQIDYQARLKGIEEDHRLACLDNYGHTAFVDGFDVTQQPDPDKYKVTPGVVYVGGLRGVLTGEVLQTIATKPNGLYVDVVRQGTALSVWQNNLTIVASEIDLTDYVDGNGNQHYVAKLAGVNADGAVVDWRVKGGVKGHLEHGDPHEQYLKEDKYNQNEMVRDSALKKMPVYPEVVNDENRLAMSLDGTTLTIDDNQIIRLYGWLEVNTSDYLNKSFKVDLAKAYHVRFNPTDGFYIKDVNSLEYNPDARDESDKRFDTTYDDMNLALIYNGLLMRCIHTNQLSKAVTLTGDGTVLLPLCPRLRNLRITFANVEFASSGSQVITIPASVEKGGYGYFNNASSPPVTVSVWSNGSIIALTTNNNAEDTTVSVNTISFSRRLQRYQTNQYFTELVNVGHHEWLLRGDRGPCLLAWQQQGLSLNYSNLVSGELAVEYLR